MLRNAPINAVRLSHSGEPIVDGKSHGQVKALDFDDPRLLKAILAAAGDAIVITEADSERIVYANEAYCRMTGYDLCELIGKTPRVSQGPDTDRATLDRMRANLVAWQPFREEVLNYRRDGSPFWVELSVQPLADEKGWFTHWVSVQRDITARRLANNATEEHARELEEAHKLARLSRWRWCAKTKKFWFCKELLKSIDLDPQHAELSEQEVLARINPADHQDVRGAFSKIAILGEASYVEFEVIHPHRPPSRIWARGRPIFNGSKEITGVRGLAQDVTEFRNVERRLLWSATHDALTGLLNLEGLRAEAPALLAKAQTLGHNVISGLVDLDDLKLVNDTLGHSVGDHLIIEAARRLTEALGSQACLARLGGDEFLFLATCGESHENCIRRIQTLIDKLKEPLETKEKTLDCSASIGIVIEQPEKAELQTLMQNADLAMYSAKETGRGGYAIYAAELKKGAQRKLAESDLARLALHSKLVMPFFQPQVCLTTGKRLGFEALLRLQIGDRIIPPSKVAHAFESVELATRLGDEMLRKVLEQIRHWRQTDFDFGKVAINVSAAELMRPCYPDRVLDALKRAEVNPQAIELEVTEGVLIGRTGERCESALARLKAAGIDIVLDDFGTGYASLTHLKRLPINKIKIDRSFVQEANSDPSDAAIVIALIQLAHALGLNIVAEGIETSEQADFLRQAGCKVAQGFYFGKALAADQFAVPTDKLVKRASRTAKIKKQVTG